MSGRLLLAHGGMDDNVHVQNALQLAHALQNAGQEFDLMLYPASPPRDLFPALPPKLRWDFVRETMLVGCVEGS